MRGIFWKKLEVNKLYYIEYNSPSGFFSSNQLGIFQEFIYKYGIPLIRFNPITNDSIESFFCSSADYFTYYELEPLCLQEIREYTPNKIPTLHSLAKYQLSTEEIRVSRTMYDGLF